ncbi:efflux RND transporter permease subunit [Singulisphaera acidiphila]|uniref:Hydrophobe/amphiphile efflux-1 (HAE1) family transporter n=1 Tax=Singulisphaera acidiphila (strain ATCC BAA-1392 / DSM 18658 / VKM B-2454 / MOB10) TaxID=886293 RepID=L0DKI0_SINAD|nr:multidrug efflux RND transporter permease subunit [Singulisphaera acidiphila]AGA29864.1 hydrophobe/amphiphile efflux-1 (HAE1) family transporter [Singulisphaera acidiphila DSM 18658]
MVDFFIRRPIFATVSALLMLLIGGICAFLLPIAQYPQIAPPQVQVTTTYTGADALSVARTVTTPIEQQINGTKGLIYYSSDSTSNGVSNIVATFDIGYSQDMAAVDIQNRVQTAQAQLPPEVKQYGVSIKKTSTDMVCVVNLISPDGRYDSNFLDNYGQIYVADVLKRINGISDATVIGRKYAMRIWIDPDRMANMRISPSEVIQAIQQENVQAAAGKIGGRPVPNGQDFELPITVKGRLEKATEFEEIIVRRNDDGSIVRVKDIARVELSSENYETSSYISGKPAGGILIYQYADANALAIVSQVRAEMDKIKKNFPEGLDYKIVYNTTEYVHENISEVEHTLLESFALVMIVVFIFLQGFRATIIPMLAIPVSLVATFAVMAALGFSINSLTLCGLVLAIGLVVDDAIIVVENVEKYLHRGFAPLEATRAAMAEITTPIVTITLVLAAVFVPVAFMPGMTGKLYNQFAMTIVISFVFSAFNSLTFSPAMARLFLKAKHGETKFFLFRWFNAGLRWIENSYDAVLEFTARHWWTIVVPSVFLLGLTVWMLTTRPKAFIPTEDQGYLLVVVQTPDGTSGETTARVLKRVEAICREVEGVRDTVSIEGLNVINSSNQSNCGVIFPVLEEWSHRKTPGLRAQGLAGTLQAKIVAEIRDAQVFVLLPPAISGLSPTGGFEMMIEDRAGKGVEALQRVVDKFQDEARKRPELAGVFSTYSARVPQLKFDVDRTKARRLDVPISDIFAVLQANLGGYYVNDFDLYGKVWKVMIQAEGGVRSKPEDIQNLYVLNRQGKRVHLSSLGDVRYALGPIDVPHYNLYASAKINGGATPGFSSGQGLAAMEEVAAQVLPDGFGYEWTGATFQEQKTGNQATYIFALSVVCVFLFMAALYESWIRPLVIILTVPLAMFGAVVGLWLYDMPLDVFGQIGLVMLIGLETKNAILIVEFGVEMRQKHGMSILESAKVASRERLRPILMTSFAFVMGVLPMARATGAGAYSRNSLGIVIAFGIGVSTVLGRFVIPIYYVLGERLIDWFSGAGKGTDVPPPHAPQSHSHPHPTHESEGGRLQAVSSLAGMSTTTASQGILETKAGPYHPTGLDGGGPREGILHREIEDSH